jgi:hypothetical protein
MAGEETMMCLGAIFLGLLIFMFGIWREISTRKKYPIRVDLKYDTGLNAAEKKTIIVQDRLGYIKMKDKDGKESAVREWQLMKRKKPVMGFDYSFVCEKYIWSGFKKVPYAIIHGVMGENGEEFKPVKFILEEMAYKPVFDGDRGMLFWKLTQDVISHNTFKNWLQQHILELARIGAELLIFIVLLVIALQLNEVAKNFNAAANTFAGIEQTQHIAANATPGGGSSSIVPNYIGGIPIGAKTT